MPPNTVDTCEATPESEPLLFTPIKFGSVTLKNRIVIAPMCQYSAEDGFVTEWHRAHLGARAIGGAGVVMMEATAVEPRGRISKFCPGIWKDEHIPKLKEITDFIKTQNSVPAIQLAHSGRKGSTFPPWVGRGKAVPFEDGGWQTIAPSPIGQFVLFKLSTSHTPLLPCIIIFSPVNVKIRILFLFSSIFKSVFLNNFFFFDVIFPLFYTLFSIWKWQRSHSNRSQFGRHQNVTTKLC